MENGNFMSSGCLRDVEGWLKIGGLEHAKCKEEAQKAEIGAKPGISGLHLAWSFLGRDEDSDIIEKEVLDGLQPHPNLQGFMVEGYNGLSFPSWLARMTVNNLASLDNLAVVRLLDCRRCGHLPTLGQLPVLKTLVIDRMEAVRKIGPEFYTTQSDGNDVQPESSSSGMTRTGNRNALFPALTTLEINNCRNLAEWLQPESTNPPDVESFPCLENLKIVGCPLLTIITPTRFPSLRDLELRQIKSAQRLLQCGKWSKLTSLILEDVKELTHLPKEFGEQFTSLETLKILDCDKLACLPEDLGKLTSLKMLKVFWCPLLKTFPEISGLRSLIQLSILGCEKLTETPTGLDACTSLETLWIVGCRNLDLKRSLEEERVSGSGQYYRIAESVLRLPRTSLEILATLCCRNLDLKRRLEEERVSGSGEYYRIPESVLRLPRLRLYGVGGNGIDYENEDEQPDHFVPDISPLLTMKSSLRVLGLVGWPKLKSLPDQLRRFTALEDLVIIAFDGLEEIPEWIGELSSLRQLQICLCRNLRHLPSRTVMLGMKKLNAIVIEKCPILAEGCAKDVGPEWDKISHIKKEGLEPHDDGIRKTTLARRVYENEAVIKSFTKRIWIYVSDDFNINRILSQMIEVLATSKADLSSTEALTQKLHDNMGGAKYLLVLDDVWNTVEELWVSLKTCLHRIGGSNGSQVLVTTRSNAVVDSVNVRITHYLEGLPDEDSWALFKQTIFANGEACPSNLEQSGRNIVGKCNGVPLAIKSLGATLRLKRNLQYWKSIENMFYYCSIYRKGAEISKEVLIELWMAQGLLFLEEGRNLKMEEIGENYFNILLNHSFLQLPERNESGDIFTCRMHDLVHDLARFVSRRDWLICESGGSLDDESSSISHWMISYGMADQESTSSMMKIMQNRLRTIRSFVAIPDDPLMRSKIRAGTTIKRDWSTDVPDVIGELKHLRYLDLSFNPFKELPESITNSIQAADSRTHNMWLVGRVTDEAK
ncbi:hypothetical protein Dimus_006312 [Dionaea muscipula]